MNHTLSTNNRAFVDLKLGDTRLVSQQATSMPAVTRASTAAPKPAQIQIEVTVGFTVGLSDPTDPKELVVEIDYKAVLKLHGTTTVVAEYTAKHACNFTVSEHTGFDTWTNIPQIALVPYLAVANSIAQRAAEATLLSMGIKGVDLPRISTFEPQSQQPTTTTSTTTV